MESAKQWNPPKMPAGKRTPVPDVQSADECTGLLTGMPLTQAETEAVMGLYALPGDTPPQSGAAHGKEPPALSR